MFIVDEEQIQRIYNKINGLTANSFEGKTIIDPAIDIGDKIVVDGKSIIYQGEMTLEGRFIADISSKIQIKQKEETTVKKESQTVINRKVKSEINQIDGRISQLVQENSENSEKLTKHEQTIDSMKDTISSVETKVETVETKADTAQSTANTAKTNAQKAQNTADETATQITTTNTKLTEVEKTVDGITQTVSAVEEKVETVETKADTAQSTANTAKTNAQKAQNTADGINTNLTDNYYTRTETNSQINQKADSITSETNKKIESIQIGGTNLLQDSAFSVNTNKWNIRTGISIDTENKMNANNSIKMNCSGSNRLDCKTNYYADYKKGENLTLSVWIMCPDVSKITTDMNIWIGYRDKNGNTTGNNALLVTPAMFAQAGSGKWFKVKITGSNASESSTKCTFMCATNSTTGIVYVSSPKLERGTKDTDWSYADEDVVKDIELGTKIEQNWEHVKIAWNQISEFIQMMIINNNASFAVLDNNKNILMSLDKTGQHFHKNSKIFRRNGSKNNR